MNSVLTLVDEGSYSATFDGSSVDCLNYKEIGIEMDISNVSGTSPTLDVIIQHQSGLNEDNWSTLYTFTQKTATGIHIIYIPNDTEFGFLRNLRANCTIGGTMPVFTFSIIAIAKE